MGSRVFRPEICGRILGTTFSLEPANIESEKEEYWNQNSSSVAIPLKLCSAYIPSRDDNFRDTSTRNFF
jgi:hypothetical protein